MLQTGIILPVYIKSRKVRFNKRTKPDNLKDNIVEVETFLRNRMTTQNNLVVTVKWSGYDEPTEEHINKNPSIRRTEAFVAYCRSRPELRSFVPVSYKHLTLQTNLRGRS